MQNDMIVKVCGMSEAGNIRQVENVGIDWMGFIFYPKSQRCVTLRPDYLPAKVHRVGVFVDAAPAEVCRRVESFGLHYVQLHGQETPGYCRTLRSQLPASVALLKAFRLRDVSDLSACADYEGLCSHFLFDTPSAAYGGSGVAFDWSLLKHYDGDTPFFLSGGIGPECIDRLKRFRHPRWQGIDLNSRFESAPGVKDAALLRAFLVLLSPATLNAAGSH